MLFEPLTGVLLAALLLAQRPSAIQLLGGALVLAGATLVQLSAAHRRDVEDGPLAE
jgi:drug/metabolite transporter (DMT)-like permease